jgi:hypothetical protein
MKCCTCCIKVVASLAGSRPKELGNRKGASNDKNKENGKLVFIKVLFPNIMGFSFRLGKGASDNKNRENGKLLFLSKSSLNHIFYSTLGLRTASAQFLGHDRRRICPQEQSVVV